MNKYYTGVGSRQTPKEILNLMTNIARFLNNKSYILRSGGAIGADSAFEKGSSFSNIFYANDSTKESMDIASKFHPAWYKCSEYAKKLHGRNSFQILGKLLNTDVKSKLVICWTPDGCISHKNRTINTGGTGTSISIASYYDIPIFNLQRKNHFEFWLNKIKNNEELNENNFYEFDELDYNRIM